jgi:hypothetical protein
VPTEWTACHGHRVRGFGHHARQQPTRLIEVGAGGESAAGNHHIPRLGRVHPGGLAHHEVSLWHRGAGGGNPVGAVVHATDDVAVLPQRVEEGTGATADVPDAGARPHVERFDDVLDEGAPRGLWVVGDGTFGGEQGFERRSAGAGHQLAAMQ